MDLRRRSGARWPKVCQGRGAPTKEPAPGARHGAGGAPPVPLSNPGAVRRSHTPEVHLPMPEVHPTRVGEVGEEGRQAFGRAVRLRLTTRNLYCVSTCWRAYAGLIAGVISSAVEYLVYTERVSGSNPLLPRQTKKSGCAPYRIYRGTLRGKE